MTCRTLTLVSAMSVFLTAISANPSQAQQYVFRSVDVPGAAYTSAQCNNNLGQIVGFNPTAGFSSPNENFLLSLGVFEPVHGYPGGESTLLIAVNPSGGKMVGSWTDKTGSEHGFLLFKKKYTSFDYPGAVWTEAIDINDSGDIVGTYFDVTAAHGFKLQSGTFTNLDPPGAVGSFAETINNSGAVVGYYSLTDPLLNSGLQGYFLNEGSFTSVNYPGAAQTAASGLNSSGQIVGWYVDNSGIYHGFSDFSGTFATVDYPGAANSEAIEINDAGQILGDWYGPAPDFADQHGYLATPLPGTHDAERGNGFAQKGRVPLR